MKIGFITVSFHSIQDTLDVVKQLEKNTLPLGVSSTVYVVDNDCSVDLREKLSKYPQAVYVESPGNVGFAAGNNLGFKKALLDETDIIVMINNDTVVPEDLILKILASPISDKNVGAVGGLIYFAKGFEFEDKYQKDELGQVIWYAGGQYDWDNVYANHLGVNEVDKGQFDGQREVDFITGCLFIVRSEILKKVGLFDERYCLYFEDSDLGMRIKKAGYKLVVDSNIKLWHKVAQSSGIGSPLNDYFLTRNRLLFGMDYARPRTKIALLREAVKKLFIGTKAQKQAVRDFFVGKLGGGSWIK
ncbi:MAG TPA: glycosyltransferase family 2 protein [Candidatus Woesebacteria bacterium]|nr:glycosyltransferase family 2 protein [Candidatus Woesebacteria bacterium]